MNDHISYMLDMTDKIVVGQKLDDFLHPKADKSMVLKTWKLVRPLLS